MDHDRGLGSPIGSLRRDHSVVLIDACNIRVLNPRSRNKRIFAQLVENIAAVGLKRPITVARGGTDDGSQWYEVLCGQGRLEALKALGEASIPCCIVQADQGDRYLISLAENVARRKHSNEDLLKGIRVLDERGYTGAQIAKKTNLDSGYVYGVLHLLKHGEQRLIAAVEQGVMAMDLALKISRSSNAEVQAALIDLYEGGTLNGDELMRVRGVVNKRDAFGKKYALGKSGPAEKPTPKRLLKTYQSEVRRQKALVKNANIQEQRLLLIVRAMKRLLSEEHFRTLLRAEGIVDIPKAIADRLPAEILP